MKVTLYTEPSGCQLYTRPFEWARYEKIERVYGTFEGGVLVCVYDGEPLCDNGDLELVGYKGAGKRAYLMGATDLPVEFFNHQLFEYDPANEDDVLEFLTCYGLLFSPSREDENCFEDWGEPMRESDAAAKDLTEQMEEHFRKKLISANVVSLPEASLTLRVLQEAVTSMMALLKNSDATLDDMARIKSVLDAASRHPLEIVASWEGITPTEHPHRNGLRSRGLLVSAICNQIVDALDDPALWRTCACEGCERLFKYKQSKSAGHDSDSKYCCDKCMERQKKRNQRAAAKNRIKH